jgi:histidinol dehydrogenase
VRSFELRNMSDCEIADLLSRKEVDLTRARAKAETIIQRVRSGGDAALESFAREYEGFPGGPLRVAPEAVEEARRGVPKSTMSALKSAKDRIETFHSRQGLEGFEYSDRTGTYGMNVVPLSRVGVYAPGGTASYPSSVLMACVPARLAGVEDIVLFTPGSKGRVDRLVLAAASLCGVDEVYAVGGAQAIAAMAYGTETIERVDKIVGPGGAFVSAAKLAVRGDCEIDFLAGPSEVLIVADDGADPDLVAADMLAQLEHDPLALALLVTPSKALMRSSMRSLNSLMATTGRAAIVRSSAAEGAVFVSVGDIDEALDLSNRFAPEHLVLDVSQPRRALAKVKSAGSVFLGRHSSVAFGDYCAGTNHILPTKGKSRTVSGLSVVDFQKSIPFQFLTARGATILAPVVDAIATAEGLPAHVAAAKARAGGKSR